MVKIFILLCFLGQFSYSQNNKPVIIKGFDDETFIKYPGQRKWNQVDSVDTNNLFKYPTRVEYTNFDGETIDLTRKRPVFVSDKNKIVKTISVANDPSKDHYQLYFQLNEKAKVMIQVYTTDGDRISDEAWEDFEKGMNKVKIKKKFYKGSYVIYLTIGDEVFKHRVLFD